MYYNKDCKHLDTGYNVIKRESTPRSHIPPEQKYTCKINRMIDSGCPCCPGFEK
jgi:hypothetical protein